MRKTYIVALIFLALAVAWLLTGLLMQDEEIIIEPSLAVANDASRSSLNDGLPVRVRGLLSFASDRYETVQLRGQTRNKRTVSVRFETSGRIQSRSIELGDRVARGDVLFTLETEDRKARVNRSQDALLQAEIEYDGFLRLKDQGFQTETNIAAAKARLSQAQVNLVQDQEELKRSNVIAPFDGSIEQVHAETGEWVQAGAMALTLVDLDPMRVVVHVAEKDVHRLKTGMKASVRLISGEDLEGEIVFVGKQSERATRTFRVEMEIANEDYSIRSGLTADVSIPVQMHRVHRVSSALLALDDAGNLGIRVVNEADRVEFKAIQIISEDAAGMWVGGLPETTTIITVGQEYVIEGALVEVEYAPSTDDVWDNFEPSSNETTISGTPTNQTVSRGS